MDIIDIHDRYTKIAMDIHGYPWIAIFFDIPKFWDSPQNLGIFLGSPQLYPKILGSIPIFWDSFGMSGEVSQKIPIFWNVF